MIGLRYDMKRDTLADIFGKIASDMSIPKANAVIMFAVNKGQLRIPIQNLRNSSA